MIIHTSITPPAPTDYIFSPRDTPLLDAARSLLAKTVAKPGLPKCYLNSLTKLQRALNDLPRAHPDFNVVLTAEGPTNSFGGITTFYYWEVALTGGIFGLSSGGYFHQLGCDGDSFTGMMWEAQVGKDSVLSDYRADHPMIRDLKTFEAGVASVNYSDAAYSFSLTDPENPLLPEMEDQKWKTAEDEALSWEDYYRKCEDDDRQEEEYDCIAFTVLPVDADETALAQQICEEEVHDNRPVFRRAKTCDFCNCKLNRRGLYVDGALRGNITWADMCVACFTERGVAIGWGMGQIYARQPNRKWRMVAGFRPPRRDEYDYGTGAATPPADSEPDPDDIPF